MRIKKIRMTRELVIEFFAQGRTFGKSKCLQGLPPDAVLCGAELLGDFLLLAFTHPSFEDVREGEVAPVVTPLYRRVEEK